MVLFFPLLAIMMSKESVFVLVVGLILDLMILGAFKAIQPMDLKTIRLNMDFLENGWWKLKIVSYYLQVTAGMSNK